MKICGYCLESDLNNNFERGKIGKHKILKQRDKWKVDQKRKKKSVTKSVFGLWGMIFPDPIGPTRQVPKQGHLKIFQVL